MDIGVLFTSKPETVDETCCRYRRGSGVRPEFYMAQSAGTLDYRKSCPWKKQLRRSHIARVVKEKNAELHQELTQPSPSKAVDERCCSVADTKTQTVEKRQTAHVPVSKRHFRFPALFDFTLPSAHVLENPFMALDHPLVLYENYSKICDRRDGLNTAKRKSATNTSEKPLLTLEACKRALAKCPRQHKLSFADDVGLPLVTCISPRSSISSVPSEVCLDTDAGCDDLLQHAPETDNGCDDLLQHAPETDTGCDDLLQHAPDTETGCADPNHATESIIWFVDLEQHGTGNSDLSPPASVLDNERVNVNQHVPDTDR